MAQVVQADLALVRDDADHIVGMRLGDVGVAVDERRAHVQSVFLVYAKDDRLLETITTFFKEIAHFTGYSLSAFVND